MGEHIRNSVYDFIPPRERIKQPRVELKMSDITFHTGNRPRRQTPSIFDPIYAKLLEPRTWCELSIAQAKSLMKWAKRTGKPKMHSETIRADVRAVWIDPAAKNDLSKQRAEKTRKAISTSRQPSTESCSSETD